MYTPARPHCPLCISSIDSALKAEKVVKPPQTPTVRKTRVSGEIASCPAKRSTAPMTKEPRIFTVRVPPGNPVAKKRCDQGTIRKRSTPPSAEPAATYQIIPDSKGG